MLASDDDAQVLFGVLAVELRFAPLCDVAALAARESTPASSLKCILLAEGILDEEDAAVVEAAIDRHLAMSDGDAGRCLQSFAGSAALEALSSVLERTATPAKGQDPTIAKLDAWPVPAVQSGNGWSTPHEPATEIGTHERAPDGPSGTRDPTLSDDRSFQLLRPLAHGGLGEVFVARDGSLNREVALKLIRASQAGDAQGRARFLLEAEITGGLEHPGIVPVYALGEDKDGRPFYVMRLVRGETLKDRIRSRHAAGPFRSRSLEFLQLLNHFLRVCDVVAYAHSRGVLHRDLKPSNVMLGKFGETLVVDWGLAKSIALGDSPADTARDELTLRPSPGSSVFQSLHGAALGTPQYMSPEQALGQLSRIGPHSDVYSLGATLYCILTGHAPLAEVNQVDEVLRRVALGDIPSARTVKREVPETLDAICRKAMAVDPADRYASPMGLAADVESWLADEPVQGVHESLPRRLGRWERRHRAFIRVSVLAVFALALVSIAAAIGVNSARNCAEERGRQAIVLGRIAEARKQEADRHYGNLRRLTIRLTLDRGLDRLENNERRSGLLWLARSLKGAAAEGDPLENAIRINLGAWSSALHQLRGCLEHNGPVRVVAWSPSGGALATGSDDGTARVWDPVSGTLLFPPLAHSGPIRSLAFSHDGSTLASASEDHTARLWDSCTGLPRGEPLRHGGAVTSVGFSADDATLVTASTDGSARLWDVVTGEPRGRSLEGKEPLETALLTPCGKTVVSLDKEGTVRIWDVESARPRVEVQAPRGSVESLALSPDGMRIACGGRDGILKLIDVATGGEIASSGLASQSGPILTITFNSHSTRVATGSYDTSCRLWCVPDLKPVGPRMEQRGHVWAVAFSPDGSRLAAAADDNTSQVWDLVDSRRSGCPLPHHKPVRAVAFSSDGRLLATGCEDGAARIWQLGSDRSTGEPMIHSDYVRACRAARRQGDRDGQPGRSGMALGRNHDPLDRQTQGTRFRASTNWRSIPRAPSWSPPRKTERCASGTDPRWNQSARPSA